MFTSKILMLSIFFSSDIYRATIFHELLLVCSPPKSWCVHPSKSWCIQPSPELVCSPLPRVSVFTPPKVGVFNPPRVGVFNPPRVGVFTPPRVGLFNPPLSWYIQYIPVSVEYWNEIFSMTCFLWNNYSMPNIFYLRTYLCWVFSDVQCINESLSQDILHL